MVHLEYYCPVFISHEWICEVVVAIDQEHITHWFIPPLKPAVDVKIISLVVVLEEGGPKEGI